MRTVHKFLLVVALALGVPLAVLGWAGTRAMHRIEAQAGEEAARALGGVEQARLADVAANGALRIDRFLSAYEDDVADLRAVWEARTGGEAPGARTYADPGIPGFPGFGYVDPKFGAYADYQRKGPGSPWLPRRAVEAARRDPAARASLAADLARLMRMSPLLQRIGAQRGADLDLVWIVLESGATNVWPPYDYPKLLAEDPNLPDVDETREDYVRLLDPAHDPERRTRWLEPYADPFKGVWMTSCVAPLYDDGTFEGTLGMDVLLPAITSTVQAMRPGEAGYAFLLTRSGRLVAAPEEGVRDLVADEAQRAALLKAFEPDGERWTDAEAGVVSRTSLADSPDPAVRALAAAMATDQPSTRRLGLGGRDVYVAIAPVSRAGWSLAVVLPVEAALAPAETVRAEIRSGGRAVVRQYVAWFGVLVAASAALALILHAQVVRPLADFTGRIERLRWDRLELEPGPPPGTVEIARLEAKFAELLALIRTRSAELAGEKALLDVTLRSIGEGVVVADVDGRVTMLNAAAEALTGWSEAEARGRPIGEVLRLEREATGERVASGAGAAGIGLRARNGAVRTVIASTAPIRGDVGVVGQVAVLRDITEQRRVEEELMRLDKLATVRVLAGGIAHDFNNLLTTVLGYVSLARHRLGGRPEAILLSRAERAVGRAHDLTRQLLTFTAGGEPVRRRVSLVTALRDASEFGLRGSKTGLDLDVAPDLWPAQADEGQISQVVQNLVINAAEAMPAGGTVHVSARNVRLDGTSPPVPAGPYLEVAVRDEGPGIAPEHLPRIFDPFFTTKATGTGLGLAVCASIVQKHGGHITVASAPGGGAVFRFWLPAVPGEAEVRGRVDTEPPHGSGRVLVMDDDAAIRGVLREMLVALGYEVEEAVDGAQAIARVEASLAAGRPFSVAIVDLTVPGGMGGREVLPRLRALDPELPVLVASGYSDAPVTARPREYGFAGALIKPVDLRSLAEAVAKVRVARVETEPAK